MIDGQSNNSIEEKHASTREIVKCFKGVEASTIPILSVLNLQLKRSLFLKKSWLDPNEVENLDPYEYGYRREKDGSFTVNLQNDSDPFFYLPKHLLKGCSCRTNCLTKKCSRLKDEQSKKCSKVTCKCKCWDKRQSADENMEEEYMEVDELEDDWHFDEDMIGVDVDATEEEDNTSISSQECVSDDEYIPFSFQNDDADDFLD